MMLLPLLLFSVTVMAAGVPDSLIEVFDATVRSQYGDSEQTAGKGWGGAGLTFVKVETQTLAKMGPHALIGVATFANGKTGEDVPVEFIIRNTHGRWHIDKRKELTRTEFEEWTPDNPKSMSGQGKERGPGYGPAPTALESFIRDSTVDDLSGNKVRLSKCPAPRCVLMLLDPWTPDAAVIAAIRGEMQARNMPLRFVVTTDQISEKERRATNIGPQALIDTANKLFLDSGYRLPMFVVIEDGGVIVKRVQGTDFRNIRVLAEGLAAPPPAPPNESPSKMDRSPRKG